LTHDCVTRIVVSPNKRDTTWHTILNGTANTPGLNWRKAKRPIERKRVPMGAQAAYDAALAAMRAASRARFDFEIAGAKIVDIATLPITEWVRAMRPRQF
jgi:hypothetical protein